jgi:ssDNA-binding Zn-finger/Zn-ribbon topoisomerase 1
LEEEKIDRSRHIIKLTQRKISTLRKEMSQYFDSNGFVSYSAKENKYIILGTNSPKNGLAQCPECKMGQLMVIRSARTKKRFMGCSNYQGGGCTASSPLLQKARLRATKKVCEECMWPIVIFRYSRKQKWSRQCSNIKCKTRHTK